MKHSLKLPTEIKSSRFKNVECTSTKHKKQRHHAVKLTNIGDYAPDLNAVVTSASSYEDFLYLFGWFSFHKHLRFTGQQGNQEAISLTPLYHFHLLHRHLDTRLTITIESSHLHIA